MAFFEGAYAGVPPWDIGHPQPEIVAAYKAGEIQGRVLDVGCGTGEHALFLAEQGHEALGIDAAPTAIAQATSKAKRRGSSASFRVFDALKLPDLGVRFDAIVDSGLFHVFHDRDRTVFAQGLHRALAPGGSYHMLCFSELEPGDYGPRRVRKQEILLTFHRGWQTIYIRPARFEANFGDARAWFCHLRRT